MNKKLKKCYGDFLILSLTIILVSNILEFFNFNKLIITWGLTIGTIIFVIGFIIFFLNFWKGDIYEKRSNTKKIKKIKELI